MTTEINYSYNEIEEEKFKKTSTYKSEVDRMFASNPDEDGGMRQETIKIKQNQGAVPTDNIAIVTNTGADRLLAPIGIADNGGAVYANTPDYFSYKNLTPINLQQLERPTKFDFSFGCSWYLRSSYSGSPATNFSAPVYLTLAFMDTNQFTYTGSYVANGTGAADASFVPFLNLKLGNISWNPGTYSGILFNQPLTNINLFDNINRGVVENPSTYFNRDFRNTDSTNYRDKIDYADRDRLLNNGSQISLSLAIGADSLDAGDITFLNNNLANIGFSLSYSFTYYARLIQK